MLWRGRLGLAELLMVVVGALMIGFTALAFTVFETVPLVAGVLSLGGVGLLGIKTSPVIGRLTGEPSARRGVGRGEACGDCMRWCLAATELDEPCTCGCDHHGRPR